jgi:diguanylate cyclase (GGDEF)-like protein
MAETQDREYKFRTTFPEDTTRKAPRAKIKMQSKLIVIFIFLVVVPVFIMGKISFDSEKETIYKEVSQGNLRVAEVIAQEISKNMINVRNTLNSVSILPDFRSMDKTAIKSHLDNLLRKEKLKKNRLFHGFYVFDSKGEAVYNSYEISDRISRMWHLTMVKGSPFGHMSTTYIHTRYNEPRMLVGQLIRDDLYEISGVIVIELDLTALQDVVKSVKVGKTGYAYVVDSLGRVIAHPDPRKVARKGAEERLKNKAVELSLQNADSGVKNVVSKIGGPLEFTDEAGLGQLSAYTNIRKYGFEKVPSWGVIVQEPTSEAYKSLDQIKKRVVMVIIFCIIAASVIAVLIALSITVPLENLVRGVKLIAKGDLDHPLNTTSQDEIGVLTHHFDEMRQNLQLKISEIETLYTLGQEMNSTLDYNALINIILEDIIQALGAEKGSLMLYDEESRKLTIRTARGLSEKVIESTSVSEGEGIAGMVLKLKQPILINDCEKDSEFLHLKGGKVSSGCLMSVPLVAKEVMRGVINISKSEPNSFTKRDLNFFQGLATQASIALENARLYKLAITDGLTKLYIHRYFQQRLDEEMKRALRYGSEVSLILTDIDHFKNFNDTYGHQQGDRVLKEVAKIMRDSMREVDIVARYGGEEFTVICPEKSCDEIIIPAERLRRNVEEAQFFINGERVPITISLGISTFPADATEKKMLIERADQALYYAKEHGRNRICLFRDIRDEITEEENI